MVTTSDSLGTLGILGGGQLSRLTALAARALGYRVHALDPNPRCAVSSLVERLVVAPVSDKSAALDFASGVDVVTLEVEHVPASLLAELEQVTHVRPGSAPMHVVQDRGRQKQWLSAHGLPVGAFRVTEGASALQDALRELGGQCFVKAALGGFDGRGQCRASQHSDASRVLKEVGSERVSVEQELSLRAELSVLVARRPCGDCVAYPAALNHHEQGILAYSVLPAELSAATLAQARDLALDVSSALNVVGLCVVELFLLEDGTLIVNEIAPRPHGELWLGPVPPALERALETPGVRLHIYGKGTPRVGRKMGHLSAIGNDAAQALERVQRARQALFIGPQGVAEGFSSPVVPSHMESL
jgi:5-(carboxyamino)imidazole ribonucleotide synthase